MEFIDTHAHLYLNQFNDDRDEVIKRANGAGIKKIILPNIDSGSLNPLNNLCDAYPQICFPLIGLHPTSVKDNYKEELQIVSQELSEKYFGIGEIGIDLYWDKTYLAEQIKSFKYQIDLAIVHKLPVVIHARESFNEILSVLDEYKGSELKGVFHAFTGTVDQACYIIENFNFHLGIGGIVTFKNSGLDEVVRKAGLQHIVLETDSPYLAPVPYRGKRNESSYLIYIAEKVAEICSSTIQEVAERTLFNTGSIFGLK